MAFCSSAIDFLIWTIFSWLLTDVQEIPIPGLYRSLVNNKISATVGRLRSSRSEFPELRPMECRKFTNLHIKRTKSTQLRLDSSNSEPLRSPKQPSVKEFPVRSGAIVHQDKAHDLHGNAHLNVIPSVKDLSPRLSDCSSNCLRNGSKGPRYTLTPRRCPQEYLAS